MIINEIYLGQKLAAEFIGTGFLLATVVGSFLALIVCNWLLEDRPGQLRQNRL